MPPEPSVTSACEGPRLCTLRYLSALLPKSFERPGPKSVRPAMYCSGVAVVLRWRWIVDMRGFLIPGFPRDCADDRSSVRGDVRVANEDAVGVPADFERARARCRKNHTLAGCK